MVLPILPDTIVKTAMVIGFGLMVYGITDSFVRNKSINNDHRLLREVKDSTLIHQKIVRHQQRRIVRLFKEQADTLHLTPPFSSSGNILQLHLPTGDTMSKNEAFYKQVKQRWDNYQDELFYSNLGKIGRNSKTYYYENEIAHETTERTRDMYFFFVGAIIFLAGYFGLVYKESIDEDLQLRQFNDRPKYYSTCQSCCRKFNSMIKKGTEQHGEQSIAYCEDCYRDGAFVEPDLQLADMVRRTSIHIRRYNWFKRKAILSKLKELERWTRDVY